MIRKTIPEMVEVMLAADRGESVDERGCGKLIGCDWAHSSSPGWNWREYDYRVTPAPCVIWKNRFVSDGGIVCFEANDYATRDHAVTLGKRPGKRPGMTPVKFVEEV